MAAMKNTGEIIMLFKSPAEIDRDARQIQTEFNAEWAQIIRDDNLITDLAKGDVKKLAGIDVDRVDFIKAEVTRLDREFGGVTLHMMRRVRDALNKYNSRNAELRKLAERSKRFRRSIGC